MDSRIRIWDGGTMRYPNLYRCQHYDEDFVLIDADRPNSWIDDHHEECGNDVVVMFNVGITDTDGEYIYEGDIVTAYNHDSDVTYGGKVVFDDLTMSYQLEDTEGNYNNLYKYHNPKVIGNIYENKD